MCVPFPGKFQRQLQRDLGSGQYGPLIMRMPRQDGSMLFPALWLARGLCTGLCLPDEDVQARAGAHRGAGQMSLIPAFLTYEQDQMFDPPDEEAHRRAVSERGESALFMYRWWRSQMSGDT